MSIRRLQTLVAFAETGSFVETAEKVHLTPAAVGQQMKALEQETGRLLFDRNHKIPVLNPAGQALVSRARKLIRDYQELISGSEYGDQTRELTLGAVDTAMTGLVPRVLTNLRERDAGLRLRIVPGLSAELLPQIDRGSLDAALISEPRQHYPHIAWRPIAAEPLVLIAPEDTESNDPIELLNSHPFIRFSRNAWVGELIDRWLIDHRIQVQESMELATLDTIYTMVSSKLGVSIVPDHCVPPPRPVPIKRIALGGEAAVRVLGLLWRADNTAVGAIRMLGDELESVVKGR